MKLILICIVIQSSFGQVKIGDNPTERNINSILEIESLDKGVRIPRLALTATTNAAPLTAHVDGMIVYNTANQNDVEVGMYINNGTRWFRITTKEDTPCFNAATNEQANSNTQNIYQLGSVGINTQNVTATLDVNGNAKIRTLPEIANGKLLVAGTDGSLGVAPSVVTTQGFFAQSGRSTKFNNATLTNINNGDPVQVIFASTALQFNNVGTLTNSILNIDVAGTYEVSGSLAARPDATSPTTANATIQVSRDGGNTWRPLTTSRSIYASGNLRFFQTINISGAVAQLNVNDKLRVTITKPFGGDWGIFTTSNAFSRVSTGEGMPFSRTWKIIKL